jgi:dTDP-4-dehydrorhamnose reductase
MEISKILVTGTSGQLGFYLAADLHLLFPNAVIDTPLRSDLDCANEDSIGRFFHQKKYDVIFHCAAYTQVDKAEEESDLAETINGKSIEWMAKYHEHPIWFWYISTDYVFSGNHVPGGYTEELLANPINAYGSSKWHGEENVRKFFPQHTIIRVAWLYSTRGKNFFKTMLHLGQNQSELNIVNDQIGSPTYVKALSQDLINGISLRKEEIGPLGTFHYSPDGEATWFEFAQEIFTLSKQNITLHPVSSDKFPQKAKRPSYSYLNHSKWINSTGVRPKHWKEQLQHCWEDWQKIQ